MLWRVLIVVALLVGAATPRAAQAHFLWIVTESKDEKSAGKVKVYFGESAEPDDPSLLDRVTKAQVWAFKDGRKPEAVALTLTKGTDALEAELPVELKNAPIVLKHSLGVLTRGESTFLLQYYAKAYPSALPGTWRAVNDLEKLPLEVVPKVDGDKVKFQVEWQGKTQPGDTVTIVGPGIDGKIEGTTDDNGIFSTTLKTGGLFSIRAKHVETVKGEVDGKSYSEIRHYSTLTVNLTPAKAVPVAHAFPDYPQAITSFGGAVDGDWLYVYGGHHGDAHSYSQEGQSGDFRRLNLKAPQSWEDLPGGPKLTGLALVTYKGMLYRVGGFTATNKAGEKESIVSQADFARFNPATKTWENLPALPEPRSSLDAAVVGNILYVVGGWNMQAGKDTTWHETAWSVDLSAEKLVWTAIPNPPFQRRAVAVAAFKDKLYVIGGMKQMGGTTMEVGIYDPATKAWSEGPALPGVGMDGFGSSAFATNTTLFATTMSGSLLQLNAAGTAWEFAAQLAKPRFFHRLLSWQGDRVVIVAGASMKSGKITSLEAFAQPAPASATTAAAGE